jgi:hypothetical protein
VVLLLLSPWWIARHNRLKAEHLAEPIAKRLTNRDIDVKCPGLFGLVLYETNEGSVQFDADGVPANATQQAAEALAVFTHELMHLRGSIDEGQTECEARQHVEEVALQAGVSPDQVPRLEAWQAGPWQQRLPDRYRNVSC